jgi:hypothetical protein
MLHRPHLVSENGMKKKLYYNYLKHAKLLFYHRQISAIFLMSLKKESLYEIIYQLNSEIKSILGRRPYLSKYWKA